MGRRIIGALLLGALVLGGTATQASAETHGVVARPAPEVDAGPCADRHRWHAVRHYHATGLGSVALRCGKWEPPKGWGYRKLVAKGRWNTWYDGMIGAVLETGEMEHQGAGLVYRSPWFTYCNPDYRFVVLVDTRTFGHDRARGVITAYKQFRTR
jgi:hypothetical protein